MRHPKCFVVHIFFSTALWSKTSCILVLFTAAYVLLCYSKIQYLLVQKEGFPFFIATLQGMRSHLKLIRR